MIYVERRVARRNVEGRDRLEVLGDSEEVRWQNIWVAQHNLAYRQRMDGMPCV